jgi:signal transduction histidine kinase
MSEVKVSETANVLASFAHDLRSPLNAVIGFSRIMLKGIDGPLSEMQATDLEAIHANGSTMLEMVDNLIDLAKAEAGWLTPSPTAVHVHPLLEKIISLAAPAAKAGQVEIDYTAAEIALPIQVDPSQTQKAIERLLAAAMRLIGSGKITLTATSSQESALIHLVGTNPDGLPPEAAHSLEAFRSGGLSEEHRIDVTALQLLVSRQLCALNQSAFEIEDPSGTEIHLTLRLPLSPAFGIPMS